ncbi:MAG: PD-(D/E)XK nuclease family protein [Bacteroidaceae bacterium]|nr:PD-(D/E)XK nuclease family protein [Bacteroidaceae bacterium]
MIKYIGETHTYELDGRTIPSVTQMLSAVFPEMYNYDVVDQEILKAAQEYGTWLHAQAQGYLEGQAISGEALADDNFMCFKDLWDNIGMEMMATEFMLYNDDLAGRVDIIARDERYRQMRIMDIKTTASANRTKTQYQLSMYKYLAEHSDTPIPIDVLEEIWIRDGRAQLLQVTYKGDEWCNAVIEAYYNGQTLSCKEELDIPEDKILTCIKYFEQYEAAKEYLDTFRETLLKQMIESGKNKVQFGPFIATLRAGSTSKRFDSAKFKKEHPDMCELYEKEVETKPSVVLTKDRID